MKNLFEGLANLKGGQFVAINGYSNSYGEVANYVINGNVSVEKLKKSDLKSLKNCGEEIIHEVVNENNINIDIVRTALAELVNSAEKNLSENKENRTKQSQAQTDAYINLGKGLKLNKENETLLISGLVVSKKVLVEGVYPTVNSRPKTIAKKAIEKKLALKMLKYRQFTIKQSDTITLSGTTATY